MNEKFQSTIRKLRSIKIPNARSRFMRTRKNKISAPAREFEVEGCDSSQSSIHTPAQEPRPTLETEVESFDSEHPFKESASIHTFAQEPWMDSAEDDNSPYISLSTTGEIRLVRIEPDDVPDGRVSCRMVEGSLDDQYIAISYAWGENTLASTISLNGRAFRVTSNCELLLRALRRQEFKDFSTGQIYTSFWIDALCIDQHNVLERNAQVAQMDAIYSKARKTVVYLGEHDEHSAMVLPYQDRSEGFLGWKDDRHPPEIVKAVGGCEHTRTNGGLSCSHPSHIESFSNREWFYRTWVVQEEVILARECEFLVSSASNSLFDLCTNIFPLTDLLKVWFPRLDEVQETSYYSSAQRSWSKRPFEDLVYKSRVAGDPPAILGLVQALTRRDEQHRSTPEGRLRIALWRLHPVMNVTRDFRCSDPRDKIFSILSLFPKPWPKLLQPDYQKTVCETYADTMWFLIGYGETEAIMTAGSTQVPGVLNQDLRKAQILPSWVIDFSRPRTTSKVTGQGWQAGFANSQRQMVASRQGLALTLRGVRVAMVQSLCQTRCPDTREFGPVREKQPHEDAARFDQSGPHHGPEEYQGPLHTLGVIIPELLNIRPSETDRHTSEVVLSALSTDLSARKSAGEVIDELGSTLYVAPSTIEDSLNNRCGVYLEDGRLAIVPLGAHVGDWVCVLLGVETPMLLRPLDDSSWQLVGQSFVASLMGGKAVEEVDWETIHDPVAKSPLYDFRIL